MQTLRSQYHLHQFASPSRAICKPLITFGHSLSSVFPCSKDQLSIANKLKKIIFPLYSASVRLCWVHFQNRKPPEVPSNPNYSMITKVLLYLTPFVPVPGNRRLPWSFKTDFIMERGHRQERVKRVLDFRIKFIY